MSAADSPALGPHPYCRVCGGTGTFETSVGKFPCSCPEWATRPLQNHPPDARVMERLDRIEASLRRLEERGLPALLARIKLRFFN